MELNSKAILPLSMQIYTVFNMYVHEEEKEGKSALIFITKAATYFKVLKRNNLCFSLCAFRLLVNTQL